MYTIHFEIIYVQHNDSNVDRGCAEREREKEREYLVPSSYSFAAKYTYLYIRNPMHSDINK